MGSRALRYVVAGARETKSVFVFFIVALILLGPGSSVGGEVIALQVLHARHSLGYQGWLLTVCIVISLISLFMLGILLAIDELESDDESEPRPSEIK